jgi:hypothetical protein
MNNTDTENEYIQITLLREIVDELREIRKILVFGFSALIIIIFIVATYR